MGHFNLYKILKQFHKLLLSLTKGTNILRNTLSCVIKQFYSTKNLTLAFDVSCVVNHVKCFSMSLFQFFSNF